MFRKSDLFVGIIKSTRLCLFLLQISSPSGRPEAPTGSGGCNCPAVGRQRDGDRIASTAAGENLRNVRDGAKDRVALFAHLHQYRHVFSPLTRRRFVTGTGVRKNIAVASCSRSFQLGGLSNGTGHVGAVISPSQTICSGTGVASV